MRNPDSGVRGPSFAADPDLSAVLATWDTLPVGALKAGRMAGRRVPEDLSVVGHGDNPEARLLHPALATVTVPKREVAVLAVDLLLRRIAD